ncbi:hypothetical protein V3C99_003286 [Haemonchus contortus]|uniref:Uncharacterized protein n=1 Tax=Haemonchus contortus TaxID=6289 RepID=A0A7I4XZ92_HAECO
MWLWTRQRSHIESSIEAKPMKECRVIKSVSRSKSSWRPKKVEKVIANVSTKIKSTADLQVALEHLKDAREPADVLEVTHLYASARKTKAAIARLPDDDFATIQILCLRLFLSDTPKSLPSAFICHGIDFINSFMIVGAITGSKYIIENKVKLMNKI